MRVSPKSSHICGADQILLCTGVSELTDNSLLLLTSNTTGLNLVLRLRLGVEIIHHNIRRKRYHCYAKSWKHARKHGAIRENRVFPPRFPLRPRVTKQRWVGHD